MQARILQSYSTSDLSPRSFGTESKHLPQVATNSRRRRRSRTFCSVWSLSIQKYRDDYVGLKLRLGSPFDCVRPSGSNLLRCAWRSLETSIQTVMRIIYGTTDSPDLLDRLGLESVSKTASYADILILSASCTPTLMVKILQRIDPNERLSNPDALRKLVKQRTAVLLKGSKRSTFGVLDSAAQVALLRLPFRTVLPKTLSAASIAATTAAQSAIDAELPSTIAASTPRPSTAVDRIPSPSTASGVAYDPARQPGITSPPRPGVVPSGFVPHEFEVGTKVWVSGDTRAGVPPQHADSFAGSISKLNPDGTYAVQRTITGLRADIPQIHAWRVRSLPQCGLDELNSRTGNSRLSSSSIREVISPPYLSYQVVRTRVPE